MGARTEVGGEHPRNPEPEDCFARSTQKSVKNLEICDFNIQSDELDIYHLLHSPGYALFFSFFFSQSERPSWLLFNYTLRCHIDVI